MRVSVKVRLRPAARCLQAGARTISPATRSHKQTEQVKPSPSAACSPVASVAGLPPLPSSAASPSEVRGPGAAELSGEG